MCGRDVKDVCVCAFSLPAATNTYVHTLFLVCWMSHRLCVDLIALCPDLWTVEVAMCRSDSSVSRPVDSGGCCVVYKVVMHIWQLERALVCVCVCV